MKQPFALITSAFIPSDVTTTGLERGRDMIEALWGNNDSPSFDPPGRGLHMTVIDAACMHITACQTANVSSCMSLTLANQEKSSLVMMSSRLANSQST